MSTNPTSPAPAPPPASSAELIAGSDDLLTELLSHLPVKPLLRFKSVNKQFLSLISSPNFSLLHSIRHSFRPSSGLFFLHRHLDFIPLNNESFSQKAKGVLPFLSLTKSDPIDILQSCNGLLLCSSGRIFNPTNNQTDCVIYPRRLVLGFTLVFDVSLSVHYQVVCVWQVDSNSYAIDVYDSGTRQWRPVVNHFLAPFDVEFERGVYCKSRVYWLSHTDNTVVFDLGSDCVETLILPSSIEGAYIERFRYFGESCGHLHLVEIRTNCVPVFEILELDRKEGTAEWFVKYKVNLDVVGRGFESEMFQDHSDRFDRRFRFYAFSILAVILRSRNGDDGAGDSELVLSVPGKVISYNLETNVSRLICDVVDESDKWLPCKGYNAYQFIESLYCL